MKTLLLLILLFAPTFADDDFTKKIQSRYDRFKDETTVFIKLSPKITKGYAGWPYMTVAAKYKGQKLLGPPELISFAFHTDNKNFLFLEPGSRRWIFMVGDKRAEIQDISYGSDAYVGGIAETLVFGIKLEGVQALTLAKLIEFQIGNIEGRFTDKDMNLMKAFADYLADTGRK